WGDLGMLHLDSAHAPILKYLLVRHVAFPDSALAARMLADFDATLADFVKVLPRNYAAVLETRAKAADEGLDPDGDTVWRRILEVTNG
ncbi:MAG: hypothetical protein ACTHJL_05615, partial [Amnibacterium sp.]